MERRDESDGRLVLGGDAVDQTRRTLGEREGGGGRLRRGASRRWQCGLWQNGERAMIVSEWPCIALTCAAHPAPLTTVTERAIAIPAAAGLARAASVRSAANTSQLPGLLEAHPARHLYTSTHTLRCAMD